MKEWPTAPLREVVDYPVTRVAPENSPGASFTYIDISAVDAERKEIIEARTLLGGEAPSRARQRVLSGDVLVATTRPNLNAVAKVSAELGGAIASTGFAVLRPRAGLDADYLFHWTRNPAFVAAVSALVQGALYPAITDRQVLDLTIPLPPLDEQRRIAARLRDQLAGVERARSALELRGSASDDLLVAILRQTFAAAQGGPTTQLRDVIRPRNDIVHPRDNPAGVGVFVGLEHVEPQTGRRIGEVSLDLASMTGRKAHFVRGDVVYGYLRPYLNKVWIAEFSGYCSVDQYVFVVDSDLADREYVAWYMRSPAYLDAAPVDQTPGQLPRIRLDEVLSTLIPLPPLDEQRQIAARLREQLAEIDRARAALEAQRAAVNALPAALLRDVFGEVSAA